MSSLELLISILKYVNSIDSIEVSNGYYVSTNPLISAIIYLANDCLIGDDGHPDRTQMDIVSKAGFLIFPGEIDRFGWVTACIELSRGIILFG